MITSKTSLAISITIILFFLCFSGYGQITSAEQKQVDDVHAQLIGTWQYEKTTFHGTQIPNLIDSGRVYVFKKNTAFVIESKNGKQTRKKYKYRLHYTGNSTTLEIGKYKKEQCELGYSLVIHEITEVKMAFHPCYNDHYNATFIKHKI